MTSAAERLATLAATLDVEGMLPSTQVSGSVSPAPAPGSSHTHIWNETPIGTVDGVSATMTLAATPLDDSLLLFRNGLLLRAGVGNDYTLSGVVVTFLQGNLCQPGDIVLASYAT